MTGPVTAAQQWPGFAVRVRLFATAFSVPVFLFVCHEHVHQKAYHADD
jgi:hypothetical protein